MNHLDLTDVTFPISPSPDSAPFWEAIDRGELVLPTCGRCDEAFWYPRPFCPRCGRPDIDWVPHDGDGVVHAFTIQHHASTPHLQSLVPFVTVLVELGAVRMLGLLDAAPDPDAVRCGQRVRLTTATTGDDRRIPLFIPVPSSDEDVPNQGASR